MFRKTLPIILSVVFLTAVGSATVRFFQPLPIGTLLSPLPDSVRQKVLAAQVSAKKVVGFLPFWNLSDVDNLRYRDLSLIYYFGVNVNPDGSFDKTEPGWQKLSSPEFQRLQTETSQNHVRLGLALLNMDQDSIASVVSNPDLFRRVITNTVALMKDHGFTDLDIDFEYVNPPTGSLSQNFTRFTVEMTAAVHQKIPDGTVSVAAMADAASRNRMTDIAALGKTADFLIVMAYDFHRLDSVTAGPVAPLFGRDRYEYDVYSSVVDYLSVAPSAKIVLGIPFYGYEWPVENRELGAFVLGTSAFGPAVSTYKQTMDTAQKTNSSVNFDENSESPWFSYFDKDSQTWRQVWFENERSLGLKLDLVNQSDLGGIAIWALGYDGPEATPLWQTTEEKLQNKF